MEQTCVKCGHVNPAPTGAATEACPSCGAIYAKAVQSARRQSPAADGGRWASILGAILVVAVGYWWASTYWDRVASSAMQRYEIAKRSGSHADACAQAGLVSAALLQAKNEKGYAKWRAVEQGECTKAAFFR